MDDSGRHSVCNEPKVISDELDRIRRNIDESENIKDLIGLALAGSCIRSATFNPGLLQALHCHEVLQDDRLVMSILFIILIVFIVIGVI